MINSLDELRLLLVDSTLEDRELITLPVDGIESDILAIEVKPDNAVNSWYVMRSKLEQTGRWPVLVCGWNYFGEISSSNWASILKEENLFYRPYFAHEYPDREEIDISPQAMLDRASQLNVEQFFSERAATREDWFDEKMVNQTIEDRNRENVLTRFGTAIDLDSVQEYWFVNAVFWHR